MSSSVGVGLTNACDLACAHCLHPGYAAVVRALAARGVKRDPYYPLLRGERVALDWAPAARRQLLKTGSACTTVLAAG